MHPLYRGDNGEWGRESNEVTGMQLAVNYAYGHPSSSLLFYPTGGGAALINHSDKPNAEMVWSDHPSNQKDWFELDPMELVSPDNAYFGLMMEIVATKDIKEGEESKSIHSLSFAIRLFLEFHSFSRVHVALRILLFICFLFLSIP